MSMYCIICKETPTSKNKDICKLPPEWSIIQQNTDMIPSLLTIIEEREEIEQALACTSTFSLPSQLIVLQINPTLSLSRRTSGLSKSSSSSWRTQTLFGNSFGYKSVHEVSQDKPISVNNSCTPAPDLALVSKNSAPVSLAYSLPSS